MTACQETRPFQWHRESFKLRPVWTALGAGCAKALPAFHAFTGADKTGRFARIGKATWLQVFLRMGDDVINALRMLGRC